MAEPFLGQLLIFAGNFAPQGWAMCNGQLLSIQQNSALFSLLGTTYGGDGVTTFALPDLRGRVPLHFGGGPGLSNYVLGERAGNESVQLLTAQMPAHTHSQPATGAGETTNRPNNAVPAEGGIYGTTSDSSALAATTSAGGNQSHENRQPYLVLNYIIALQGIFPSRS
jgi:microcystin-dependent protein